MNLYIIGNSMLRKASTSRLYS